MHGEAGIEASATLEKRASEAQTGLGLDVFADSVSQPSGRLAGPTAEPRTQKDPVWGQTVRG